MTIEDFALTSPVPVGGRESHDHYPTPRWVTEALVRYGDLRGWWPMGTVLDPACGEGAILDVMQGQALNTLGYEIHEGRAAEAARRGHSVDAGDALARPLWGLCDAIVMNPPYSSEAGRFVHRAVAHMLAGGCMRVCALLYVSFAEPAADRGGLFREFAPDMLILPRRPKFDGKGTNSTASAWFCWPGTGDRPGEGRILWLPP